MEKSLEKKLINEVSTPFYVFDIDVLKMRIDYLKSMMPENVHLCYAMKANPFVVKEIDEKIEKYVTNRDGSITIDSDKLNEMIETKVQEQYTYSLEEKKVGKWVDGKDLYRKTFVYDTPTSGNTIASVGNIGEYDTAFVDYSSSFYINTNKDYASTPSVMGINSSGRNVDKATYTSYTAILPDGNVAVYYGSTTASSKTVVTVNYTKK